MTRVLLADDEPHARETLRLRLEAEADFEVVGEAGSGGEALAAIRELRPDLVFLDIRMPDLSGFDVLERLERDEMPLVVFVTAYDEHALRAFDFHALAYLLKPFDDLRFAEALRHVRRVVGGGGSTGGSGVGAEAGRVAERERLRALLAELAAAEPPEPDPATASAPAAPLERLVVRSGTRTYFVAADEIDWIEAAGDYARLHCGERTHLVARGLAELAEALDARRFARIHRSAIVAIDRIRELTTDDRRDFTVVLRSGQRLRLSRTYRPALEAALGDRI